MGIVLNFKHDFKWLFIISIFCADNSISLTFFCNLSSVFLFACMEYTTNGDNLFKNQAIAEENFLEKSKNFKIQP